MTKEESNLFYDNGKQKKKNTTAHQGDQPGRGIAQLIITTITIRSSCILSFASNGKGKDQQPQDKTTRVQEAIEWKWEYSNSNTVCFSFFYMML
jgi:hypothetical protein